ncbi:MAG: hypothetical protein HFG49_15675 [Lachnospiraceae bacterium]|jgi:hypothetical protein|nr:hypothetical protein [Lachnospiraceae bacterium]
MALNPFQLLQFQQMLETFRHSHPKLPLFFQAVSQNALVEGTIIEITAKTPEGKEYCTNIKLNASDIQTLESIKRMKEQS